MVDCYIYDYPGRSIVLGYPPQDNSLQGAAFILDAMDELQDLFVPLCASISLQYRNRTTGYVDRKIRPRSPFHDIYQTFVPEEIVVQHSSDKSIHTPVEKLSKDTILSWIENAFRQESPQPDTHELELSQLSFEAVRAKIHDDSQFKEKNYMTAEHDRRGNFRFPLERRDDGLWVYSPIEKLRIEPSFTMSSGETAKIKINVRWSWWIEESTEDRDAFESAILRIIARGWTIKYLDESLKLPRLRSIYEASGQLPR